MLKPAILILLILITISTGVAQNANRAANPRPARAGTAKTVAPAAVPDEDIPPPAKSTVRGRVYYEDTGRPVRRSSIMLLGLKGGGENSGLTDSNGNFTIDDVAAGTYFAMVNAPGVVSPIAYFNLSKMQGAPDEETFAEAAQNFPIITVDGVNDVQADIPAKKGAAISGRLFYDNGDPAIGVRVEVLRKKDGEYTQVISNFSSLLGMLGGMGGGMGGGYQTDDRGMYRFSGLPAGEYIVKASETAKHSDGKDTRGRDGFAFAILGNPGSLLTYYYPDKLEESEAEIVNLLLGQELSEINMMIPDQSMHVISGRVTAMKDKKPMTGATVTFQRNGPQPSSGNIFAMMFKEINAVVTTETGEWKFKDLPKGSYTITVQPPAERDDDYGDLGSAYGANRAMNAASNSATPRPRKPRTEPKLAPKYLTVELESQDVNDLNIELGYGGVITGSITADNNKDMPDVTVSVYLPGKDESLGSIQVGAKTSIEEESAVRSSAPLKPNEFRMEGIPSGKLNFSAVSGDEDYYVKSVLLGMSDLTTAPLELQPGETLSGIKVVLGSDVGTIQGKVVDSSSNPVANVVVFMIPTDPIKKNARNAYCKAETDEQGKFQLKLAPWEYYVLIVPRAVGSQPSGGSKVKGWLDEAIKTADKITIDPDKTSTITLKKL